MRHNKEFVLSMLRKIASLKSKEDYLKNFGELNSSDLWKEDYLKNFGELNSSDLWNNERKQNHSETGLKRPGYLHIL